MPDVEGDIDLNSTVDWFVSLLVRRRWWVVLTACATALATAAYVSRLSNRYTSDATILVVQPQVAERYIGSTAAMDTGQSLQAMLREVLSRPRLLGIIDEFGLYPQEKRRLAPEELIERMRKDLAITPLESAPDRKDINALKISFIASAPSVAQQVTSRLTALFVETDVKTRSDQATTATNFLQGRLKEAKDKLTLQDQRLRDFKGQYVGQLPEQQAGNLQMLLGMQTQLQNATTNLNHARQQRVYIESLIAQYQRIAPRPTAAVAAAVTQAVSPLQAAQKELDRLQSEKASLSANATPRHPDVIRITREIAKQEATVARLKFSQTPDTKIPPLPEAPAAKPDGIDYAATVAQLRSQLEANGLEIENFSKEEKQVKAAIAQYQNRVNLAPVREQQLAVILREYELAKQNYADLLGKGLQSQLATGLEKQQEGQQFRLVDPPSLPTVPSSPKRLKINLIGAVAGLILGFALACLVEIRDRSIHTEKELSQRFAAPLIIGIPRLFTPAEERLSYQRKRFELIGGLALVLAVFITEIYVNRQM